MVAVRRSMPLALFAAAAIATVSLPCAAQPAWKPERPVEIVVGSAPGGSNDKTGRMLARVWREAGWIDNAVVVNKVGAGGAVAYAYASQRAGDAHVVAVARTGLLTNHILGLSPLQPSDMTPLGIVSEEAMSLVVRADSPIRTADDLVARWRTDPQSVSISLGGSRGSTTHFVVALIARQAKVDPRKVKTLTFGGSSDSITSLLGGHIDMLGTAFASAAPHHRAGRMRIVGVAATKRPASLPEVPTFRDLGYDVVVGAWTAIVGARGLGAAQVGYWEDLLARTVAHPEWRKYVESDEIDREFMRAQPAREFLRRDYEMVRGLLVDIGMAK